LTGYALSQVLDLEAGQGAEMLATSGIGSMVGSGLGLMLDWSDRRIAGALEIGSLAGTAAGLAASYLTHYERDDAALIAASGVWGAWHGFWLGDTFGDGSDARRRGGGALLGLGVGLGAGMAVAQGVDVRGGDIREATVAMASGNMIGVGAGKLLELGDETQTVMLEVGGLSGVALGVLLAEHTEYSERDPILVGMGTVLGATHGAMLHSIFDSSDEQEDAVWGGALLGAGVGTAGGMLLAQYVDFDGADLFEIGVSTAAGDAIGAGMGKLLELDEGIQRAMLEVGGLGGAAVGLLFAQQTRFRDEDAVLVAMGSALGAAHGAMLHGILQSGDLQEDAVLGGTLLGAGIGTAGGMVMAQYVDFDALDLVEIGVATATGDAIGFGLGHWLDLDRQAHLALVEAGGLGLTGLSLWLARKTEYERNDRLLLAYGIGWGGWLGGWAPRIWLDRDDGSKNAAGVLLGASAGAVIAAGASQALDMPVHDVGETAFGTLMTSLLGAGAGLVLQPDGELWVTMMEATSVAGTLAVGWAAPQTHYSTGDAVLGSLAALYGLYNGAGLSYLADASDRQVAGAMMAAGAAGALTASYLGPYLQLDGTDILMLLAGSAWGVWTGIWTAAAIDEASRDAIDREVFFLGVGTTAVATDVAILLTSIAISKLVEMPPQQFAWISVGGGVGLVSGLLATALAGKSPKAGIAIGSVTGLAAGAVVTSFFDWTSSAVAPSPAMSGSSDDGSPIALLPQIESWFPSVGAVPVSAVDPLAPSPATQFMVTVSGTYR
jgi:hypothetical protein